MPVDKVQLHVQDTGGSGHPVILIHGWPLSGDAWAEQTPALVAAGFRAIAYDRRGFGRSEKPAGGFDYDTLTEDLAGLIADLQLDSVSLVGFSMGGGAAIPDEDPRQPRRSPGAGQSAGDGSGPARRPRIVLRPVHARLLLSQGASSR